MHYIFDSEAKTRFKNFRNISCWYQLSVHEWLIYRYRPQKSHVGRFLVICTIIMWLLTLQFFTIGL